MASAFDPRHQKGSSTKVMYIHVLLGHGMMLTATSQVMIMKRSEHHSKEEIQRQELAKLEAAARSLVVVAAWL